MILRRRSRSRLAPSASASFARAAPLALALSVQAAVLIAPPASAQPPKSTPTAADPMAEAKQRFNEGLALADKNDYEAARLKFNQAYSLLKTASVLFNLARAEQLSGHHVEALEHYRLFQKQANDPKITDAERSRATEALLDLKKKVGQITIEAPPGTSVSVDGKTLDSIPPDPLAVIPGKHLLEAVIEGKTKQVEVDAQPGATVVASFIEKTSSTPPDKTPEQPPPVVETERDTMGYVVPVSLATLGILALGVGIGTRVAAGSKSDDAAAAAKEPGAINGCSGVTSPACNAVRDAAESERDLKNVSTVGLVVGGAAIVGAVATYFLWPKSSASTEKKSGLSHPPAKKPALIPVVSEGYGGVLLRSAW